MPPDLIGKAHAVETQRRFLFGKRADAEAAIDLGADLTDGVLDAILNDTLLSPPESTVRPRAAVLSFSAETRREIPGH